MFVHGGFCDAVGVEPLFWLCAMLVTCTFAPSGGEGLLVLVGKVKGCISMLMLSPTTQSSYYRRGFLFLQSHLKPINQPSIPGTIPINAA